MLRGKKTLSRLRTALPDAGIAFTDSSPFHKKKGIGPLRGAFLGQSLSLLHGRNLQIGASWPLRLSALRPPG